MKFYAPLNVNEVRPCAFRNLPKRLRVNEVIHGDCVKVMDSMPSESIDFVLTDPPYITNYTSRDGRRIVNDDNANWLNPAFSQIARLMKPGTFCVSFYGWPKADAFISAWRSAGLRIAGHIVFRKRYASSVRFLRYQHEQAYLLTKGDPARPLDPLPDVMDWTYTGNKLHPTQKPVQILLPLIRAFCKPGSTVFDPFCGSGSTLAAAKLAKRNYVGIEMDETYHRTAAARLQETVQ